MHEGCGVSPLNPQGPVPGAEVSVNKAPNNSTVDLSRVPAILHEYLRQHTALPKESPHRDSEDALVVMFQSLVCVPDITESCLSVCGRGFRARCIDTQQTLLQSTLARLLSSSGIEA